MILLRINNRCLSQNKEVMHLKTLIKIRKPVVMHFSVIKMCLNGQIPQQLQMLTNHNYNLNQQIQTCNRQNHKRLKSISRLQVRIIPKKHVISRSRLKKTLRMIKTRSICSHQLWLQLARTVLTNLWILEMIYVLQKHCNQVTKPPILLVRQRIR